MEGQAESGLNTKYSGEIDLKFSTVPIEQFSDILTQKIFRPRYEFTSMVLGLFPEDLDIEFSAVGRKVAQEGVVFDHPAPSDVVVAAVMNLRVIKNDESWCSKVVPVFEAAV